MSPIPFIILICFAASFVATWLLGKVILPMLRRLKAGQSIKENGPTWHMSKQGTPTMGGLMFIGGIIVALILVSLICILAGWGDLSVMKGAFVVLVFSLVFGVIGFIDDYMKVKHHKNEGLTAPQKFLLQLAAAILFVVLLRNMGYLSGALYIPFFNVEWNIPWVLYMVLACFIIVGTVNAVNITDGVDGLATGVTIPVAVFYVAVSCLWVQEDVAAFAAALAGGLAAFLLYNFHPAKVFMGDTGSLFLGGTVCGLAFALDIPLLLVLVGIIYILETLSDIIQVAYFKLTHGKRIFRMAPLHHHFEMGGWSEKKVFFVFSGVTLVFCVLAYLGVLTRF